MIKPALVANPDLFDLTTACRDYLDFIDSDEYHSDKVDDYEHAIFESALEAMFGKDVFDFVNWKSEERDDAWERAQKAEALAAAEKLAESMGLKIVPKGDL